MGRVDFAASKVLGQVFHSFGTNLLNFLHLIF